MHAAWIGINSDRQENRYRKLFLRQQIRETALEPTTHQFQHIDCYILLTIFYAGQRGLANSQLFGKRRLAQPERSPFGFQTLCKNNAEVVLIVTHIWVIKQLLTHMWVIWACRDSGKEESRVQVKARDGLDRTLIGELEDQLYLQADKLLALCAAQTALDNSDEPLAPGIRSHYSLLMEEQARALRHTLEKLLG